MSDLINGIGINVEVERNWTWIYGDTYPIKEELKQQGFFWSVKRRAWYNRSIVEVNLNNGNGHDTAKEELSEHDKALLEGNYKIEGKLENKETETKINEHEPTPPEESNEHEEEVKEYQSIGQIDSTILKEVANFLSNIEPSIYPLHINQEGWNIDFVDLGNAITGNVEITKDAWFGYWDTNDMELTFEASRVKNMFSVFKKGDIAEIGFDEYNMIANWGTLTWTHKLRDVEQIVKPPQVKDFDYPVKLTIGKLTIADIKKKLKEAKKELERYDSWAGVILKYNKDASLPPSLQDSFQIYAYRFSWNKEGKDYIPALKPIIELSGAQFNLDTDKREPAIGIYTIDNFEKILKGIKSDVTLSFGDKTPLKAEFEIRQGVKVVAWQVSDSLEDEEKKMLTTANIQREEEKEVEEVEIKRTEEVRFFRATRKKLPPTVKKIKEVVLYSLVETLVDLRDIDGWEPKELLNIMDLVEQKVRISFDASDNKVKEEVLEEKEPNFGIINELIDNWHDMNEKANKAFRDWSDYHKQHGYNSEDSEQKRLWEEYEKLAHDGRRLEEIYDKEPTEYEKQIEEE